MHEATTKQLDKIQKKFITRYYEQVMQKKNARTLLQCWNTYFYLNNVTKYLGMGEMITPPMESAITEVAHYYRQLAEKKRSRAEAQGIYKKQIIIRTMFNQFYQKIFLKKKTNTPQSSSYHLKLRICLNNNGKSSDCTKMEICFFKNRTFSKYIDYIDRDEATRTKEFKQYNLLSTDGYNHYMEDPEKSSGLFTSKKNQLTSEERRQVKKNF